ncbi:hypothetical protein CSB90_3834 [Pseudomonas aeruginosa]|nr:hypothetical protein CSB90_3834 [Pseudomonas aeruginosa]
MVVHQLVGRIGDFAGSGHGRGPTGGTKAHPSPKRRGCAGAGSGRGAVRRHPPQGRGVACSGLPLRTGRLTRRALFDPASAPLACSVPIGLR